MTETIIATIQVWQIKQNHYVYTTYQVQLVMASTHHVHTAVNIPKNVKPIPTTLVHTHKFNDLREVQYKSRWVIHMRLLAAIAIEYDWPIHHLDISSAYLHGNIDSSE